MLTHQSADFALRYSAKHSRNSCWQHWRTNCQRGPAIQYEVYPDKVVVSGNSAGDPRQQDSSGLCIVKTAEMEKSVRPPGENWELPDGTLLIREAGRVWNSGQLILQGLAWKKIIILKTFKVWPNEFSISGDGRTESCANRHVFCWHQVKTSGWKNWGTTTRETKKEPSEMSCLGSLNCALNKCRKRNFGFGFWEIKRGVQSSIAV